MAAGATALTGGMTWAIQDKKVMIPAFLSGWTAITYGITDGFKTVDPFTVAGIGGIVAGGMMARAKGDWGASETIEKIGKPLFMAGWASLAFGLARQKNINPVWTIIPSATIVAGAMMMKQQAGGEWEKIPKIIPPIVFALGWIGLIAAVSSR